MPTPQGHKHGWVCYLPCAGVMLWWLYEMLRLWINVPTQRWGASFAMSSWSN